MFKIKFKHTCLCTSFILFFLLSVLGFPFHAYSADISFPGVYSGTTSGCGSTGGFSIIAKGDGTANLLFQEGSDVHFVNEGIIIAVDGSFSGTGTTFDSELPTIDFSGTFTSSAVTGDYTINFLDGTTCSLGIISGNKLTSAGTMAIAGGYYTGTLNGTATFTALDSTVFNFTTSGSVFAIVAADGSARFVTVFEVRDATSGILEDEIASGTAFTVDSAGDFSVTNEFIFAPDDFGSETISGTVDKTNFTVSGTFSGNFTEPEGTFVESATFSLTRQFPLHPPFADVIGDFGSIGLWVWLNNTGWERLTLDNPENLVVGDIDNNGQLDVIGDFGSIGLWVWLNNTRWDQLTRDNPENLVVGDIDGQ